VIGLWQKFSGGGETKFTRTLAEIERAYGIIPPDRPPAQEEMADYVHPETAEVERMFDTCEHRLTLDRDAFDPKAHLALGVVLDRLRYQFENGVLSHAKVREVLGQVLTKIGTRLRPA
jgi:hypothetical protein